MPVTSYSTTAASNNGAVPNGAPEGMSPSSVNDVIRQIMADIALEAQTNNVKVLKSVAGTNTITADMDPELAAYVAGMIVVFTPANTNTGATTIAIDGLTALDIQKGNAAALVAGDLVAGVPAMLVLDSGADDFILMNPLGVPIPAAAILAALLTVDGAGSGVDADLLDGLSSAAFAQFLTGSFTGTLTGMTGATTGTVRYIITGRHCTLYTSDGSIQGTSNATGFTMTGLPAACQPAVSQNGISCYARDTGNDVVAFANVSGSTITFDAARTGVVAGWLTQSQLGWTNSGTKGLPNTWSITYAL